MIIIIFIGSLILTCLVQCLKEQKRMLEHNMVYSFWVEAKHDPEIMNQWLNIWHSTNKSFPEFVSTLPVSVETQMEMINLLRTEMDARIVKPKQKEYLEKISQIVPIN